MVPDNTSSSSGSAASGGGSYSRQSFQRSGWCGTCGLRRGPDGRCSNCDAWWTSPLVQYGAPLVIASTFLLLMGVSLLRPKSSFLAFGGKPAIQVPAPRGLSSIPVPSPGNFGGASQSIPVPRPVVVTPPQQIAVPAAAVAPEVAREAALLASQQQLNQMAASVNSTLLADDAARIQSFRSASTPRAGSFQRAAAQQAVSSASQAAF